MAPKQSKQDPKSRAASTSGLNQPSSTSVLPPAAHPTLCSFNASHSLFASVSRTLGGADKLRLWNTADNRVVGDWDIAPLAGPTVKSSVSCVSFVTLEGGEAAVDSESSARQKKRKKNVEQEVPQSSEVAVLAQGTELLFYGQTSAKQLEKISLGSKIQSLASHAAAGLVVATEKEVIIMDASTGDRLAAYPLPSSLSSTTSIAIHYEDDQLSIILASIQLVVLTVSLPVTSESDHTFSAVQPAGAESIRHLQPISAADDKLVFAAVEENARVASIWQCTLDDESAVPTILASVPCPSSSPVQSLTATQDGILFLLSQAGEAWGYEVTPATLSPAPAPESGNDKKKKRRSVANSSSLKPVITIEPSQGTSLVAIGGVAEQEEEAEDKDDDEEMEVDASARSAVIGRMIGPNRVRWEQVAYRDATGALASEIKLKKPSAELGTSGNDAEVSLQRYRETAHTGSTTTALARDEEAALTRQEMELPVEGEMADMTLGERLLALDPAAAAASAQQRAERAKEPEQDQAAAPQNLAPQSAQSLTRMLLQALHTSDPQLLSLILTSSVNSTPVLIRNTVRRLPASMALPLLKACVDRLGKGRAFGRRGGGRGGGLNERQGSCVVAWIRGVLVERGSVLMTIPSLPVHLASLSQLLQARLQLQQPLQSLSGRLDLAMAQIETRKEMAAAMANQKKAAEYVEGESDSEESDEDDELDVEIEHGGNDGEIEDIGLESRSSRSRNDEEDLMEDDEVPKRSKASGGSKKTARIAEADDLDDEEDLEEDDDEEDFDDSDEDGGSMNGFIDDEAEEASDDESDQEEFEG